MVRNTCSWLAVWLGCGLACGAPRGQPPASAPASAAASEAAPLLDNAAFLEWEGEAPRAWSLYREGEGSAISRAPDGITLRVSRPEAARAGISQHVAVRPGAWYRLRVWGRAHDLQGDAPRQQRWAGVAFLGPREEVVRESLLWMTASAPEEQTLTVQAPPGAELAAVRVSLTQPGALVLRQIELREVPAPESFAFLVDEFARHYSHFETRGIEWAALAARYRADAAAARDPDEFVRAITPMLAELRDVHVWMAPPHGPPVYPFVPAPALNLSLPLLLPRLRERVQFGRLGFVGEVEGFGYAAFASLRADEKTARAMTEAIAGLRERPGLVLDLRGNTGGDEALALRVVGLLADQERPYSGVSFRAGPAPGDFTPPQSRTLRPTQERPYTGPLAVLIGPACVSSCEAMAMMLRTLPNAVLIGQATQGASGNPQPVLLPNGVSVYFSRWKAFLPDGSPLEGRGLAPDLTLAPAAETDTALDAALSSLRERAPR